MLHIIKEKKGDILVVRLSGALLETADLERIIGPPAPKMQVFCKEITRTNSAGIMLWVRYFSQCKAKGSQVSYHECSPAIVEQINLVNGFLSGGKVESITLPFLCISCQTTALLVRSVEEIRRNFRDLPEQFCPKCGEKTIFDDFPEEYFAFLTKDT